MNGSCTERKVVSYMFSSLNSSPKPCFQNYTGLTMQPSEFVNPLKASNYCRSGNFCVRCVCTFNFRHVAKWRKLNAHVRNYLMFNFRHLSNWRKIFHSKNFPIYGKSRIEMCNLFLLLTDTATFFIHLHIYSSCFISECIIQ